MRNRIGSSYSGNDGLSGYHNALAANIFNAYGHPRGSRFQHGVPIYWDQRTIFSFWVRLNNYIHPLKMLATFCKAGHMNCLKGFNDN